MIIAACALSFQSALEWYFSRQGSVQVLQRATQIQPLNSENFERLGAELIAGRDADFTRAAPVLHRAIAVNPYSIRAYTELAELHRILGEDRLEFQAAQQALRADPTDPSLAWEVANLYIVNGDIDKGLSMLPAVLENEPNLTPQAISVAYRGTNGDIQRTTAAIPRTTMAGLALLHWLVDQKQYDAATKVWPSVLQSSGKLRARDLFFYFDNLVARKDVGESVSLWRALEKLDTELSTPQNDHNLISNGDFESNFLNGGFGWRYDPAPGISTSLDTSSFQSGNRSLLVEVDADNPPEAGVWQYVPLAPNGHYIFHGFVHAEDLESANGWRISISDAYAHSSLFLSDDYLSSFPWREVTGEFVTGPDTSLARVAVVRSPSTGRIRGKFWMDDFRLEKR